MQFLFFFSPSWFPPYGVMALRTSEWWCSGNCHHLCFEKIENSLMKNNTDRWACSSSHPPQSEKLTKGVPLRLILLWLITIYHICWLPHTTGSSELEYHQNERHKGITSSSRTLGVVLKVILTCLLDMPWHQLMKNWPTIPDIHLLSPGTSGQGTILVRNHEDEQLCWMKVETKLIY